MRNFFYDGNEDGFVVAETADELISLLKEGDQIMSTRNFKGDTSTYYCGSVPTYTYSENDGNPIENVSILGTCCDTKGYMRNEADVREAIATLPDDLELDIFRDKDAEGNYIYERFFYNANGADLSWHFEV